MKSYLHLAIHDLHDSEALTSRQISARLGVPRTTVLRHLRQPRLPEARPVNHGHGKLEPYRDLVAQLAFEKLSAAQIFRRLSEAGYGGGETMVRKLVREIRPVRKEAFLELKFPPGDMAQVDFAECGLVRVGGERRKLHAFLMVLGYSRRLFVRFIMRENTEHFLACHREAFELFGGVPRRVMVDNCKVAVVHTDNMFGAAVINPRYADLAAHYGFLPVACNVRSPHEKGMVERSVGYLRTSFLNGLDTASMTLGAINAAGDAWCRDVADRRTLRNTPDTPERLFAAEREALRSLTLLPYDCSALRNVRISRQCRATFESNRYSVPMDYAGRMAELAALPDSIRIICDGTCVAEHGRSYAHGAEVVIPAHDMELMARKKRGAKVKAKELFMELCPGAPAFFRELENRRPDAFLHLSRILSLVSEYGRASVVAALGDAAAVEAYGAEYVANLLAARRRLRPEPSPIQLTSKADILDIDVQETDLAIYDR